MAGNPVHLYFHSPCFDGLVSAVLLSDYLRTSANHRIELHPVNYHLNQTWEGLELSQPAAIVDFQYHPDASIWFDHHATPFLTPAFEAHFRGRRDPMLVFDRTARSCSMLIWHQHLPMTGDHYEKVQAADLIDSASYESPHQAVFDDRPAFLINATLAVGDTDEYTRFLAGELLTHDLAATAQLPAVQQRFQEFRRLRDLGMQSFRPTPDLEKQDGFILTDDNILLFAIDDSGGIVSRYAPFTVAPEAQYSLGAIRSGDRVKITAMRNPWREFESVPLGDIFKTFGGGGHHRVASTRLHGKSREAAIEKLFDVRDAIQSAIAAKSGAVPR
jgi:hypothetical protein